MKTAWSSASLVASLCSIALAACGASTPPAPNPPPSAEAVTPASPVDAAADAGATSVATVPTVTTAPTGAADAGAGATASTPKPASVEMKDECTPVGVDFEKRARPKLKECYAQGKKKEPNLEGTVKIKVTVDVKGKIKAVKVVEKTLPDPVADCMLKVVKATPFPEVDKCWDATLTIPITFPTPK